MTPRGKGSGGAETHSLHLLLQVGQGVFQASLLGQGCCQQGIFGVELSFQVLQPGL